MERWDMLDRWGRTTGRTVVRGQSIQPGDYHLVTHAWLVDAAGRFLIQRRAEHLSLWPGLWATTGGSAVAGEDSLSAMRRELHEELGIAAKPQELVLLGRILGVDSLIDVWLLRKELALDQLVLQTEEVSAIRWVDREELLQMIAEGTFHDYGPEYMQLVLAGVK